MKWLKYFISILWFPNKKLYNASKWCYYNKRSLVIKKSVDKRGL
jgi:hypothetical protein